MNNPVELVSFGLAQGWLKHSTAQDIEQRITQSIEERREKQRLCMERLRRERDGKSTRGLPKRRNRKLK